MLNTAEMNDDFDFTTKGIAIGGVDERGKMLVTSTRDPNRKAGRHCMRILKSILTQVGLVLVLIAYLFGGGYLFRSLELSNEYSECLQKHEAFNKKLNFSTSRVIGLVDGQIDSKLIDQQVRDALYEFASQLFILDFKADKDCSEIVDTSTGAKWNLANAVYFCATVITTIGYGHITPSTFWGRISCIIYGVIGIPMMLIYLAIIGNLLAKAFRIIYVNIICCRCFYDTFRRKRQKRRERLLKWEQALRQHEEDEARRRGLPVPPPKVQPIVVDEEEDLDAEYRKSGEVIAVPLTVSIVVLATYTILGAIIFPIWEDWNFADAAYFSFITIATIGFGDLVPGVGRLDEPETMVELAVGALYLLFGLALLSMCVNLLQDEMVAKFKYMARCCGMCRENEEDEEEEEDQPESTDAYAGINDEEDPALSNTLSIGQIKKASSEIDNVELELAYENKAYEAD